jgi:flagellar motor switch protein FliM
VAEILSQEEINALIEAYKSAGGSDDYSNVPDKAVRAYDFARPDKFCKEHLRALNLIHNKHCASLAAALTNTLRIDTQISLLALDQLTYKDYCSTLPEGTFLVEVSLEPFTSVGVFEFNPVLVSMCVELLSGSPAVSESVSDAVTDIDRAIMRPIVELALRNYAEVWMANVVFKPQIKSLSTETGNRQLLLPSEPVLICCYEVSLSGHTSLMSVCVPAAAIEAILPALTLGMSLEANAKKSAEINEQILETFEDVTLECRAVLGRTWLPVSEVTNLEVGDLIRLPVKAEAPAELCVENVTAFRGSLGRAGHTLALKISDRLSPSKGNGLVEM